MFNSKRIIWGLLIFAIIVLLPFWYNARKSNKPPEVNLNTPEIQALEVKKCIEDTEYMRANHMELLEDWRVSVVREGNEIYVAKDGQEYLMCLQETCLHCHSNKEQFCDACHEYAGVEPNCWTCHEQSEI